MHIIIGRALRAAAALARLKQVDLAVRVALSVTAVTRPGGAASKLGATREESGS
jgi:hypothetical protein